MKKKLLFVIPALRNGGAERVASIILNAAVNRDYDVTVLLMLANEVSYELDPSIRVISLQDEMRGSRMKPRALNMILTMRSLLKQIKPDILVSFMTTMNLYSVLATWGLPVVVVGSERNSPGMERNSWLRSACIRFCYQNIEGLIFQTDEARSFFSDIRLKSSIVIPNPVINGLPRWDAHRSTRKCVAVGRLETQKNYPLLLQAFKIFHMKYPQYHLEIYGDGSCRTQLQEMTCKLGLKDSVFFMGVHQDVHQRIQDADMFVMSSNFEGIPNALLESLAMGIPSVATDCPCGGVRMLIKNGHNGYLVPMNNAEALSSKMEALISNRSSMESMSQHAVCDMQQYSEETICAKYFTYFESRMNDANTRQWK